MDADLGRENWEQDVKTVDSVLGLNEVSFMRMDVYVCFLLDFWFATGPKLPTNEIMIVRNTGNGFLLRFVEFQVRCLQVKLKL
jgi:hypothetical protein